MTSAWWLDGAHLRPGIKAALTEAGHGFGRPGEGSHGIWWSLIVERHVAVPTNRVSRHTANAVLRQAGPPKRS